MLKAFKKKQSLAGVDIGSSSVKVLELERKDSSYVVQSYAVSYLTEEAISEKEIKKAELVSEAIREAFVAGKIKTKLVALAMPSSLAITKIIQMDANLNESELETQIQLDANRYIPYPLEEVKLDFSLLGTNYKDDKKVDVLIAASRSDQVEQRVDVIVDAGLVPKVMDVESYAIERVMPLLLHQLPSDAESKIIAVMNIGGSVSSLTVMENLSIIYTREEAFGGKQLTEAIRNRFEMPIDQAERVKRTGMGLPPEYTEEVLLPFKDSIVTQVSNSLQFFYSSSDISKVDYLFLAGGCAMLSGLCEIIQEKNGIPTLIANPFKDMGMGSYVNSESLLANAPVLLIACGLALRSFDT